MVANGQPHSEIEDSAGGNDGEPHLEELFHELERADGVSVEAAELGGDGQPFLGRLEDAEAVGVRRRRPPWCCWRRCRRRHRRRRPAAG